VRGRIREQGDEIKAAVAAILLLLYLNTQSHDHPCAPVIRGAMNAE
jgi:hypothetical protein